jgi:hypothetical protein
MRKEWTFGRHLTGRGYLNGPETFEQLADELCAALAAVEGSRVRFVVEPREGRYEKDDPLLKRLGCKRPAWWMALDGRLLDRFFNGIMGIRAQYHWSPYRGAAKNHLLISKLTDELVRLASSKQPDVDPVFLRRSLAQPSAKAWISEQDVEGRKVIRTSDLELDEQSIQNDWLDLARDVKNGLYDNENYDVHCAALNGIRTPLPDQMEVKGAWLTEGDLREYVTPAKRDRDCQTFMFGFS